MANRSKVYRSHVPRLLRLVPAPLLARAAGLSGLEARALKADDRLMPPLRLLVGLCLLLRRPPTQIVTRAEECSLRDVAPDWFRNGAGRAKVAVCGMGNLGHALAGVLAARADVAVRVLVSTEQRAESVRAGIAAEGGIRVKQDGRPDIVARPEFVTHIVDAAVRDADLVVLCVPAQVHGERLRAIVPAMQPGAHLTAIPAAGGFNWKAEAVLRETARDVRIFGVGGIPWMCKLQGPGTVRISNPKSINAFQHLRAADAAFVADVMAVLLGMPMIEMASFLNVTLAPSNQLLHPGILYSLFKDWHGAPMAEAPLFYEGLSAEGAQILQAMSDELVLVARRLRDQVPAYWMSPVATLHMGIRVGYHGQIADPSTLRSAIVTNDAYRGVRTPVLPVPGGFVPKFGSRFLTEDVPHGMAIVKGIAEIVGIATPMHDRVMTWCQQKMGKEYLVDGRLRGRDVSETSAPQVFGITDADTLVASCVPS